MSDQISTIDQDWGDTLPIPDDEEAITFQIIPFSERDRFGLAKALLGGITLLFILGGIAYFLNPETGELIFETCKTILPPIATLVIGYYFSSKTNSTE